MSDSARAVEEIRFVMQSEVWEMTDRLEQAAATYRDACLDVNQRLRRCDEFLRRNLRSEAIHLAEAEPNLLEAIAVLDFPEREDWDNAAGIYGMEAAEPLRLDIAQELNEAYVIEQPLQKLLSRHRLLALSRAPLGPRLAVMRRLAELDHESLFWDEDVRSFERARMSEIETEAKVAGRSRDAATLHSLVEEIAAGGWREKVPKQVASNVRQYAAQVGQSAARDELGNLIGELESAFGALDVVRARTVREQWQSQIDKARLDASDAIFERAEPILGWIADEDARQAADKGFSVSVAALERALDADAALPDLERAAHDALKFDRSIPEPLASRYSHRCASLELSQTRVRRLQIGGALVLIVAVLGGVGLVIRRQVTAGDVKRVAAAADGLLEQGNLAEARQLLDSRNDVADWDHLLSVQQRLIAAEGKDRERAARLEDAMVMLERAKTYNEAVAAIDVARPLARSPEEKVTIRQFEQRWEEQHSVDVARAESVFQSDLEAAEQQLAQLEQLLATDPLHSEIEPMLRSLSARLSEMGADARGLRSELASQLALIASRRDAADTLRMRCAKEAAAYSELTRRATLAGGIAEPKTAVAGFNAALAAYIEALQDDPRAESLRETVKEADFWTDALEWSLMVSRWTETWPLSPKAARLRLAECEAFLKEHPGAPDKSELMEYIAALKAIVQRKEPLDGSSRTPLARLEEYLAIPVIHDAWSLTTKDGRTFYFDRAVDFSSAEAIRPVKFDYYIGYTRGELKSRGSVKAGDFELRTSSPAAQSVIAADMLSKLRELEPSQWDSFFLEQLQRIRLDRNLDAFAQFDLLRRTLETAVSGNVFLHEPLKATLAILQTNRIDPAARWMDPDNADAAQARKDAAALCMRVPEFAVLWASAAEDQNRLTRRLNEQPRMIGWLRRDQSGWSCCSDWKVDRDHRLQVLYGDPSEHRCEWRRVGSATPAGMLIQGNVTSFLREGRPVFAVPIEAAQAAITEQ